MNPALISLHRQGVFRQPWSTLTSFAFDFSLSLVDYFPLIPKIAVVSVAIRKTEKEHCYNVHEYLRGPPFLPRICSDRGAVLQVEEHQ